MARRQLPPYLLGQQLENDLMTSPSDRPLPSRQPIGAPPVGLDLAMQGIGAAESLPGAGIEAPPAAGLQGEYLAELENLSQQMEQLENPQQPGFWNRLGGALSRGMEYGRMDQTQASLIRDQRAQQALENRERQRAGLQQQMRQARADKMTAVDRDRAARQQEFQRAMLQRQEGRAQELHPLDVAQGQLGLERSQLDLEQAQQPQQPPTEGPFTLGTGQIRFGPNGEVIAQGPQSQPTERQRNVRAVGNRLVDADTGEVVYEAPPEADLGQLSGRALTAIQDPSAIERWNPQARADVEDELGSRGIFLPNPQRERVREATSNALKTLGELTEIEGGLEGYFGAVPKDPYRYPGIRRIGGFPWQDFEAKLNQLKSQLALPEAESIGGRRTNMLLQEIKRGAAALEQPMSEDAAKTELERLWGRLTDLQRTLASEDRQRQPQTLGAGAETEIGDVPPIMVLPDGTRYMQQPDGTYLPEGL